MSFSMEEDRAFYVPVKCQGEGDLIQDDNMGIETALKYLGPVLRDPDMKKGGQNIKYDILVLRKYGVEVEGITFDTMIASHLIDPEQRHNLDSMSLKYLNYKKIPISEIEI